MPKCNSVPTAQGKQGKSPKKIPCQGKHREFGNLSKIQGKHGNLVCSSCKLPDSKGKRYFDICHENFQIFLKLDKSAKSVCVCNSHKSRKLAQGKFAIGQGKHREFKNAI